MRRCRRSGKLPWLRNPNRTSDTTSRTDFGSTLNFAPEPFGEAETAAGKALALHTPEPSFYYHAGLIAAALGKSKEAVSYLMRAQELNPASDPLQFSNLKK